MLIIAQLGF